MFRTKSSTELPELNLIVEWVKTAGLVRAVKGRLLPVKKAAPLLKDSEPLWEASFTALGKMSEALFPRNYWYTLLEYDLGDSWRHDIVLEEILTAEEGVRYPVLLDGAGACPPEDVGGIGGYEYFRLVLADPGHDEHDEYVRWAGLESAHEFDPARFVLEAARRALASVG